MPFILNRETGVIHTDCKAGMRLAEKRRAVVETIEEARTMARQYNKTPKLCKRCKSVNLREELQKELNY